MIHACLDSGDSYDPLPHLPEVRKTTLVRARLYEVLAVLEVRKDEASIVKYKPTPRDLFNPPPQVIDFGSGGTIQALQDAIDELYPDYCDSTRLLFQNILYVLAKHEDSIGVKP